MHATSTTAQNTVDLKEVEYGTGSPAYKLRDPCGKSRRYGAAQAGGIRVSAVTGSDF